MLNVMSSAVHTRERLFSYPYIERQVNIHAGTIHIHHPGRHMGPDRQARLRRRAALRRTHAGQPRAPEHGHLSRWRRADRAGDGEVRPQRAAAVEGGMTAPARRASLRLLYDSKDISADLAPYLKSFSFTDSFEAADDLQITLADPMALWRNGWFPDKGATLKATLRVADWTDEGDAAELYCEKWEV